MTPTYGRKGVIPPSLGRGVTNSRPEEKDVVSDCVLLNTVMKFVVP